MKFYLIAAGLFATALLILGIVMVSIMNGPETPQRQQAGARAPGTSAGPTSGAQTASRGLGARLEPAAPAVPSGMPDARRAAAVPALPSVPGSTLPGTAGLPLPPPPPPIRPGPTVPIIQPTDLGMPSSPTAAKAHQ